MIPREQGDHYRVVFAESSGPTTVRLRVRRFEKQTLRLLSAARIDEISARSSLSVREVEVLRMLIDGASSAEIAAKLGISEHTVKFHRTNVLTKVGADSRADLLRLFL